MVEIFRCEQCGGDGGWEDLPYSPNHQPRWATCLACDGEGESEWSSDDDMEPEGPDEVAEQVRSSEAASQFTPPKEHHT